MDLNKIIDALNNKNFSITQQDDSSLAEEEKDLIKRYQPQNVFIVYGTLGPGRPNHQKVEHIQGKWYKATIKGKLEAKGWGSDLGYDGYVTAKAEDEQEIEGFILFSDELPVNWKRLDDFEGEEYQRILAQFKLENGEVGIGNIYALKKL